MPDHGPVTPHSEPSTELAVPVIGQVVNLEDANDCALALDAIRDLEYQLKQAKTDLTRALVHHSQQAGTKTLHLDNATVVLSGGEATVYDAEEIYVGLIEAGMTPERAGEIVKETVTRKVDARQAKSAAAANPAYREVIERHTRVEDRPYRAEVSR